MAADTKIEWCDHTFNPWEGCQKVGPGCDNCYAEARNARFGDGTAPNWGTDATRRRTSPHNWELPLRWNRAAVKTGIRPRVFCASLADVFDKGVPQAWRTDLWDLVEATPGLDWLILTKRIGNAERMLPKPWIQQPRSNVWLGATIVNQAEADRDIPKLLSTPACVRFLSMEPLLGPVDLTELQPPSERRDWYDALRGRVSAIGGSQPGSEIPRVDWVIVGGESGFSARPMHPDWARDLRDQCAAAGVPFLFKQWGEWWPVSQQPEGSTQSLYRSNRKARPHEDQGAIDDCYGRTCTVDQCVIHANGSVHEPLTPMAFLQGTGAMLTFKAGKKAAGRLLDGREWDEVPR